MYLGGGSTSRGNLAKGEWGPRAGKCLWKWRLDYEKLKLNAQIMRLGKLLALESKNKKTAYNNNNNNNNGGQG